LGMTGRHSNQLNYRSNILKLNSNIMEHEDEYF
jgi:hypothetical protein